MLPALRLKATHMDSYGLFVSTQACAALELRVLFNS